MNSKKDLDFTEVSNCREKIKEFFDENKIKEDEKELTILERENRDKILEEKTKLFNTVNKLSMEHSSKFTYEILGFLYVYMFILFYVLQ